MKDFFLRLYSSKEYMFTSKTNFIRKKDTRFINIKKINKDNKFNFNFF